ncbi:MAG: TIGR01906 family membrane protein [Dehalococcoidia bacterium]
MNRRGIPLKSARLLFVLALPLLLFSLNMDLAAHSRALYQYGLDRYGAAARLGVAPEEVARAGRELIAYWGSPQPEVDIMVRRGGETIQLFNQREVDHLRDVKSLIAFNRRLMLGLLGYAVVFTGVGFLLQRRRFRAHLLYGLRWGGLLTLGLLLLLAGAAAVNFQGLFLLFHLASFSNLLWVLDPATDRLIQMFPEGFFRDATLMVVGTTAIEGLLLAGVGWWGAKKLSAGDERGV